MKEETNKEKKVVQEKTCKEKKHLIIEQVLHPLHLNTYIISTYKTLFIYLLT